jgi:hypothetical protein
MTLAIEAVGLVKRFGKTLAVDGVDLAVRPGMVLGLLIGRLLEVPYSWSAGSSSAAWSGT